MPQDEELDTTVDESSEVDEQVDEGDVDQEEEGEGNSDTSNANQPNRANKRPFLEVDERTKYMTADDAKKGYQEAGKRIAALSAWEKELKEYDVNPSEVRAYLDELIESRQTAAQLKAELEKVKQEREQAERETSNKTRVESEAKLTKEEKEAVEWLKEKMPNLGYISKDDAMKLINQLQEKTGRIDQIEAYMQQSQERERQALISSSRTSVVSKMKEDGFPDDEEGSLRMLIESSIKDWVNSDTSGKRIQRFYTGGEVTQNLIIEGYEKAKKALGLLKSSSSSTYVKNKAEALKRNVKKLPNSADIPNKGVKSNLGGNKFKKKIDSSGKRDFIGEKHNEAWEKFKSIANQNEEE